jgi:pimeloyl-ACP methyl ester carboxylesterase
MTTRPQPPGHALRNGDVEIAYSRFGAGAPLVLLHGFPDVEATWSAQVEDLARDHLVLTPRLRGYPPSGAPDDPAQYALTVVAGDVIALVEMLDAGPAVLVGHDWGGALAQVVALMRPDLVAGLIMLNAPPLSRFDSVVSSDPGQQAMSAYTLPYLAYREGDDKNVEWVTRHIRDEAWRAEISAYLRDTPLHGMMAYYKANYVAPPYRPQAPAGHVFKVPTLIVWGTEEEYFSARVLDGLTDYHAATLRLVTIHGAGHWVHRDAAARVNAEIRSWLGVLPEIRKTPSIP